MSSLKVTRPIKNVAILGGGLAGLTSAYYLSSLKALSSQPSPPVRICVFERSERFGGWVSSPNLTTLSPDVDHDRKNLVFETGPRSVRPNGLAGLITIDLVKNLGLSESMIIIPKNHPSAKNRYVFGENGLQKLPSSIWTLLSSISKKPSSHIPLSVWKDLTTGRDDRELEDESIKSFIGRRFGHGIGEDLISAMVHGIYAGDYSELSARSTIFGPLWGLERKYGGVIRGMRASGGKENAEVEDQKRQLAQKTSAQLLNASVWGLRGGLESLTRQLRSWLSKQPNVVLSSGKEVTSVLKDSDDGYKVFTNSESHGSFDHIISALPPRILHGCLSSDLKRDLEGLSYNPSATVGVVNLAYSSDRRLNPLPPAFGYLIPSSLQRKLNPHHVLGVVFDSDMMPGVEGFEAEGGGEFQKFTVMLGGHHYDSRRSTIPSPTELVEQAKEAVEQQLGIREAPVHAQGFLHRDCIPQYLVGHHQRMSKLHRALEDKNLSVVGSGYTGAGVNDVVKSSWDAVQNLLSKGRSTGLESFH